MGVPWPLRRRFAYAAGQYVTLHVTIGGVTHKRSYSISSMPGDPGLAITVKRLPGGLVSNHLLDTVAVGSSLEVEQPRGRFGRRLDPHTPSTTYLIGAGSGIVPLVPIARVLAAGSGENVIHVLDGNRTPADVIKAAELATLAADHPNVHLIHVFSRLPAGEPAPGLRGHIDAALLAAYLRSHPVGVDTHFYVCGPDAMIDETIAALRGLGVAEDRIHQEHFAAAGPVIAPADVSLAYLDGDEVITTTDANSLVTDALERAGAVPPTTCRTGTCSTCVAQILEGNATMRANRALGASDVAAGLVLTCQAVATTPRLVLDYDSAR